MLRILGFMKYWKFFFQELLASQEGLCCMELVRFISSVVYVLTCFSLYFPLFPQI